MKAHIALLAFVLSAFVGAVAQAPSGNPSATPASAQASPNSGDASATLSPSGNQNDVSLQSQIDNALRNQPTLGNSHIVVSVTAEAIDLSGAVGSSKDRQAAERIAQSFDGNRKLNDNLMIMQRGDSYLAPGHSATNNRAAGNAQNPATRPDSTGKNNSQSTPPPK